MRSDKLYKFFHSSCFQGSTSKKNYFEGWYYKCIDASTQYVCTFIPGVSTNINKPHAFIQFADNQGKNSIYLSYPLDEFIESCQPFRLKIGPHYFSDKKLKVNLQQNGVSIKGNLYFGPLEDIKRSMLSPTIMGFFRYLPFMECFHGIMSLGHDLYGYLIINGKKIDFNGGKGYIEKDWGTSFPCSWIWVHSNTFNKSLDASLMCSIASIPFIAFTFTGLICILFVNGKEYRFATYNGARILRLSNKRKVYYIKLKRDVYQLELIVYCSTSNKLTAPRHGEMNRDIYESLSSRVRVRLYERDKLIFDDLGINAGIEINM